MKRIVELTIACWLVWLGILPAFPSVSQEDQLMPPELAFGAKARMVDGKTIEVRFDIAPDHYLYRQRFKVEVAGKALPASRVALPKGKLKSDPTFGRVETHEGAVTLTLRNFAVDGGGPLSVKITSQGCAQKAGVCYPPFAQSFELPGNSSAWVSPKAGVEESFSSKPSLKGLVKNP